MTLKLNNIRGLTNEKQHYMKFMTKDKDQPTKQV